jgi:hypothetical protein
MEEKYHLMRKIQLILVGSIMACQSFAQSSVGNDKILQITPGKTSKIEMEKLLGKPVSQIEKDDRARWKYSIDGKDIDVEWYKDQLRNCYVRTQNKNNRWNKNDNCVLTIGTEVATIVNKFGLPANMRIETTNCLMEYVYQNNILRLSFQDGQLLHYEMTGLISKK